MEVKVLQNLLKANDDVAARIRELRRQREPSGLPMINILGAPGSGKTSLIEATIARTRGRLRMTVIEGDVATQRDAERIAAAGVESLQINTGRGCHLEAHQILRALENLDLAAANLVVVENVGNLICPAEFDLGEDAKVAVSSVTEGDDKPLKYPLLFREAKVIVLNKVDLLPHVRFDRRRFFGDIGQLNGTARVFEVSTTSGVGLDGWVGWLERFLAETAATGIGPARPGGERGAARGTR